MHGVGLLAGISLLSTAHLQQSLLEATWGNDTECNPELLFPLLSKTCRLSMQTASHLWRKLVA